MKPGELEVIDSLRPCVAALHGEFDRSSAIKDVRRNDFAAVGGDGIKLGLCEMLLFVFLGNGISTLCKHFGTRYPFSCANLISKTNKQTTTTKTTTNKRQQQ